MPITQFLKHTMIFCILFSLFLALPLAAKAPLGKSTDNFKSASVDNNSYINANLILMFVTNHGNFGRDLGGVFGYDYGTWYPYTGNIEDYANHTIFGDYNPLYAAGLWIGGTVNGDTCVTVSEYSSEFVPGPMANNTFMPDQVDFKVYKLYAESLASNPNQDYLDWPVSQGAPLDAHGNPKMQGDQLLWSVFNDANSAQHTNMGTTPLGLEVQQTVWAQNEDGSDTIPTPTSFEVTQTSNSGIKVTVGILDESAFTGFDYIITTEVNDSLGFIWHLINRTNGQTILENQTDFSGHDVISNGMILRVSFEPDLDWAWEGSTRSIQGVNWGGALFFGGVGALDEFFGSDLTYEDLKTVEIRWVADGTGQNAYIFDRSSGYSYEAYAPQNFEVWDVTSGSPERQINFAFVENDWTLPHFQRDQIWNPGEQLEDIGIPFADGGSWDAVGGREYFEIMDGDYTVAPDPNYAIDGFFSGSTATSVVRDILFGGWLTNRGNADPTGKPSPGDILRFSTAEITSLTDTFSFNTTPYVPRTTSGDGVSVYMSYKVINKGGNQIDSCYISFWSDPDLGELTDDLIGCDTLSDIWFSYNSSNTDATYGIAPPAIGFKLIYGPMIPSNGDLAYFDGIDIPNYKNLPMTGFSHYFNGTDPDGPEQAYGYMSGKDMFGAPYYYLGRELSYSVSGDPVTGVGDLDIAPSDRRMMASSGPFTFAPGDSQFVLIKMTIGQGTSYLSSITTLKEILNKPYRIATDIDDIEPNSLPQSFSLEQNYPNPFNPTTKIKFSLPTRSDVTLEIFNVLGQKITTLIDKNLSVGEHAVEWDGTDYTTGIYFYKLTVGDFNYSKKMLLLK